MSVNHKSQLSVLLSILISFSSSFSVLAEEEIPAEQDGPDIQETVIPEQEDTEDVSEIIEEASVEEITETAETEPMETEEEVLQDTVEEITPEEFTEEEPETELFAESTEDGYTWSAGTEGTAAITGYTGTDTELSIPAEIDGNKVTSISANAFKNKTGITKVILPEGMKQLFGFAFAGCTSLEEVVMPSTLTMIGDHCFSGCRNLKKVNPQEGIVKIFAKAFENCTSLEEIHLPDSITGMGYQVFLNDKALKTVNYPKNYNDSFGGYGAESYQYGQLFFGCTALETVTIPDGTQKIADHAFRNSPIKTIEIPESVTLIGQYAFSGCTGLTEVSIPGSVTKIDTYAFSDCTNLTDVTLNEGLTQLQGFAFSGCTSLEEIELPSTMSYVGDHNFYGCTNLKRVSLPENLKTIYAYAFANCTSLEEIHLPDSVTTMGYRVFANDTALKTVNYPKNYNSSIDGYGADNYQYGQLFAGCTSLETVTIPEGTETIANYAFRNSNIKSIQIPESVTLIGQYAFSGCTGLTEVSIPGSVTKIDTYAFSECTNLTDVTLNEGLTQLQGFAFSSCTSLEEIKLPSTMGYVGDHNFYGCTNLKQVTLPEDLKTIYAYAFANCTSLEEIHLPDSVTTMGYRVFADDTALKTVNYPKNYNSSIDGYGAENYQYGQLFAGCTALETVLIPDGTQKIADHSFRNSNISKILIPRSVTAIGNYAFDGCTKLTDVYYQIDEESWNKISIGSVNDILTRVTMHYNTGTVDPAELVPVISASYNELIPVGTEVKFKGSAAAADSVISSWTWDFGDEHTETGKSVVHTFETGGDYTLKLTIKDILGRQYSSTAEYKAIDFNAENQGYTWIRWSVINGTDNSAVYGAEITLGTAEGEELYRFTSDSSGLAEKIIPDGRYQVTVMRQNYMPRSFEFEFEGCICERTLPMYQASILTGNITVKELTYDEIIAAGIDVNAPGNEHVYRFKTTLIFKAGLKEYEFEYEIFKDKDKKVIKNEKVKFWFETPDTEPDYDPEQTMGPGTYMPIPGGGYYIIAYPMTEKFALILIGEAHWLKEMFQVQLAVTNPSYGNELENIIAELQLPVGMSLADMTWGEQSAEQVMGTLEPGQSANAGWYIRGDAEGDYLIKAKVTGTDLEFNEAFEQNFETTDPIHVYAGSALHMTITCPDVAERGKPYTVKYRLENVSEKPIYDLTFGITRAEQYKIIGYGNQQAWLPITDMDFGEECTKQIDVLAPGGSFEFAVETTIWFNSALELIEFTKLGAYVDVVYYLDNVSQMTLSGSTTEIPYEFVVERTERDSFIDWVIDVAADEILGDLFPSGDLGGTLIEIVGDKLGLESWMIKGSKTLLKLWQGSTEYVMTISIDDGLGNENSIENDVVRITAGDGVSSVVDALNHNRFKMSARELQIEAKIPGRTSITLGIEDKYGNIQSEYNYDVIVDGHEVAKTVTVTPTGTTREYVVDEHQMTEATKDVTNELRDIYQKNPFLWINSKMEYKVDAQTDDTKGSYQIRFFNDDKSGGGTLWTKTHNNIEISSTTATLDFTRKSWQKIAEESGEEFTIIAKRLTEDEAEQLLHTSDPVYQFVVESDGKHITDFEDSVYVTVPYELTDPDNAEDIYVEHFNDDGTSEILTAHYDSETKTVSFDTASFSYFRIIQLDPSERTLTLNKNALELFKNDTEQLNVLEDVNVTWTSDHPEIASVSEDGTITAVSAGTAAITVTSEDGIRTAVCKVTVLPTGIYVRESADSYLFTGTAIKPDIEVYDTGILLDNKSDYTITYKNNVKAYTIKEGEEGFSAKKAPQIIIKAKGNYSGAKTVYFTIDPADITSSDVETLTTAYTGKVQKLSPIVVFEGKTLKKGTDYTLDYPDTAENAYQASGMYNITVTGKGNYTGTRTYQMIIGNAEQISLDKAAVTLEMKSYVYNNGEQVRPNVKTVKVGKTVIDSSLYTVFYGENNTVGNGTVTITGNDSETIGTKTVTFKITGTPITKLIKVTVPKSVTRGAELKDSVAIITSLTEGTDYEVTYDETENAGKATIVITGINGYTGTIKKTVTVAKDKLTSSNTTVAVPEAMMMKNGAKPAPTVTVNGTELVEGSDYTLSYANNKKAGTGTVTVKGKGNYSGSLKQTFTITAKDLAETTLEYANNVNSSTKKGSYQTTVVIRDEDGGVLKANTDYTLKFYDGETEIPATAAANDYAGKTLTVKASGKGNYTGEEVLSAEYTVVDSTLNLAKATITIKSQQYQSGKPVEITSPEQFSKSAMGKTPLTLGTDFEVYSYSNNTAKGTATVVFKGIGNYSGYKSVTYKIGQRTLKDHWEGIVSFFSGLMS